MVTARGAESVEVVDVPPRDRAPRTVLWQPDLAPPHHWLYPAILYHDRISTLVPRVLTPDRQLPPDVRASLAQSRQLATQLGDLYTPTQLSSTAMSLPERWLEHLVDNYALRVDAKGSSATAADQMWIASVRRQEELARNHRSAETRLQAASERRANAARALEELEALVRRHVEAEHIAETKRLAEATAELSSSRDILSELRFGGRRDGVDGAGTIPATLQTIDELRSEIAALEEQVATWRNKMRTSGPLADLFADRRLNLETVAEALRRVEAEHRHSSMDPSVADAEAEAFAESLLAHRRSRGAADGWAIALQSKMTDRLDSDLHGGPGFMFRTGPFYFAPEGLMLELFDYLATNQCARRGWTTVSSYRPDHADRRSTSSTSGDIEAEALCYLMELPAISDRASLSDVVKFRRDHDDELLAMRDAIVALADAALTSESDLRDHRATVERALKEPLREIDRALHLQGSRVISRMTTIVRNPIAGLPIVAQLLRSGSGNVVTALVGGAGAVAAAEQAVAPGTILVGAATIAGAEVWRANRGRRLARRAREGPLAYLYEVRRSIG